MGFAGGTVSLLYFNCAVFVACVELTITVSESCAWHHNMWSLSTKNKAILSVLLTASISHVFGVASFYTNTPVCRSLILCVQTTCKQLLEQASKHIFTFVGFAPMCHIPNKCVSNG